jgi:hypothetical protein
MTDVQEQFLAAIREANEDANKGQINTAEGALLDFRRSS